jgi:hypothetical protein
MTLLYRVKNEKAKCFFVRPIVCLPETLQRSIVMCGLRKAIFLAGTEARPTHFLR